MYTFTKQMKHQPLKIIWSKKSSMKWKSVPLPSVLLVVLYSKERSSAYTSALPEWKIVCIHQHACWEGYAWNSWANDNGNWMNNDKRVIGKTAMLNMGADSSQRPEVKPWFGYTFFFYKCRVTVSKAAALCGQNLFLTILKSVRELSAAAPKDAEAYSPAAPQFPFPK